MKFTFEKKGIQFQIEVQGKDVRITANGISAKTHPYRHSQYGWGYNIEDKNFIKKVLGVSHSVVFLAHDSAKQARQALDAYAEEENARKQKEKEERKQRIIAGAEKIRVSYHDGEYLSGHEVLDEVAAELLEELGLARYVEGWGYHVDEELVRTYGTEFTYRQAQEFIQPRKEAEAKKQAEKEAEIEAKFEEAKATGKPVELYRFIVNCNDPRLECSTDIIIVYAMPDGSKDERRIHTY